MLTEIFKALFLTSCVGAVLTLLLILIRPVTKKHFSSRWHYYIWLVVLAVMVLPIRIDLPKKMQTGTFTFVAEAYGSQGSERDVSDMYVGTIQDIPDTSAVSEIIKNSWDFAEGKLDIIACIWLAGVIVLFILRVSAYIAFRNKVSRNSECISCPGLKAYTDKKILVRVCEDIASPIMLGILKPELLLPKREITPEQLNNILAHEMTHFKRKDLLYKWFATLVKCIHWFNPAIYFACGQIGVECEISCDLAVVGHMDKEGELSYVNTILALLSAGRSENIPLTTGMLGNKKTLKRRFLMIKNKTKISRRAKIVSSVMAVAVMVIALSASGVMASGLLTDEGSEAVVNTTTLNVAESDGKTAEIKADESKPAVQPENVAADVKADVADKVNKPAEVPVKEAETQTVEVVWPCPSYDKISAEFKSRVNPVTGEVIDHKGIDLAAKDGADVVAATAGDISETGFDAKFGNYIKVTNATGVITFYAHLSEISVAEGDAVTAGQCIGKVGSTGASTGPHLHFEVIIAGENVNPRTFLGE